MPSVSMAWMFCARTSHTPTLSAYSCMPAISRLTRRVELFACELLVLLLVDATVVVRCGALTGRDTIVTGVIAAPPIACPDPSPKPPGGGHACRMHCAFGSCATSVTLYRPWMNASSTLMVSSIWHWKPSTGRSANLNTWLSLTAFRSSGYLVEN
jgi:hypothetical protein